MPGIVSSEKQNNIVIIEFYHPKGNSLSSKMLNELIDAFEMAGNDPTIQVIILKSRGDGAFCGGASLDELKSITDMKGAKSYFTKIARLLTAMRAFPGTVIANVHGKCVGGGVGLAAGADFVSAYYGASVRLTEISLGIGPFVISPPIIQRIGVSSFSTLALDAGNWYDASWAESHGLYNKVFNTKDSLEKGVQKLAGDLSTTGPSVLAELKRVLWNDSGDWSALLEERAESSARLLLSEHCQSRLNQL